MTHVVAQAAVNALREHGFAVVIVSPNELDGVDPVYMEQVLRSQISNILESHGLQTYQIFYREEDTGSRSHFECDAVNMAQAINIFNEVHPEHILIEARVVN